jgi:hypothetical protein
MGWNEPGLFGGVNPQRDMARRLMTSTSGGLAPLHRSRARKLGHMEKDSVGA